MRLTQFRYDGPAANLGRFGPVTQGQTLLLNRQEARCVANNRDFLRLPPRAQKELKVTGNVTLTADDSGKKVICNHTAPVTVTLPSEPPIGFTAQVFFGNGSGSDDVTIDPGTNTITGEAGTYTLTPAGDSVAFYWNGSQWKTF